MSDKLTKFEHLESTAVYAMGMIGKVAQAAADAISEVDAAKADKAVFVEISLPQSGWKKNTDTETSEQGFAYSCSAAFDGATSNDSVECILEKSSLKVASTCGLCPSTDVQNNAIIFYAMKVPTASISIQSRLILGAVQGG